jgi:hypothetical protein
MAFNNASVIYIYPMFTNALKFLYYLSLINFVSSYIFIFHQSIWKMHLNFQI